MSLFSLFGKTDINEGVENFKNTKGAVLLDVRSKAEYQSGHIQGSKNVPVDSIEKVKTMVKDLDTPLFVYCLSGARARSAVSFLKSMGYTNVENIGGISDYNGKRVM